MFKKISIIVFSILIYSTVLSAQDLSVVEEELALKDQKSSRTILKDTPLERVAQTQFEAPGLFDKQELINSLEESKLEMQSRRDGERNPVRGLVLVAAIVILIVLLV